MFEETFKNFTINFNALNPKVTFSSGDVMTGQVLFDLSKETKIQSIMISLKGKANVLWHETTTTGGGSHGRRRMGRRTGGGGRQRTRRTYSADLTFFNISQVVMQSTDASGHTILPPGKHVFPFTVHIPHGDFPPSFKGTYGKIVYSMVVAIHRPWHLAKEFDTVVQFVNRSDSNHPHLRLPLAGANSKTLCCLFCASGPVSLNAQMARKGYSPGETIKIIAEIGNVSNRTVTPYAKLVMEQIFYTSSRAKRKYTSSVLTSKGGQSIGPNTSDVHSEISLPIPQNATLTIANCNIIEVQYFVKVSLSISRSTDLEIKFPIALCSIPFDPNQVVTTAPQQNQYPGQYANPHPGAYPSPYSHPQPGPYSNQSPVPYPGQQPGPYTNQPTAPYPGQQPGPYTNQPTAPYPGPQPSPYPNQPSAPYPVPQPGMYPNQPQGPHADQPPPAYPGPPPGVYPNQYGSPYPVPNPGQ